MSTTYIPALLRPLLALPLLPIADDADAQVRSAVELMRHVRLSHRQAEARHLAGTLAEGIPSRDDILRRTLFWASAGLVAFIEDLAPLMDSIELMQLRVTMHEELRASMRHILLRDPELVAAFVPRRTADARTAARSGTPTGTKRRRAGTGRRRSGTGNRPSGTRSGTTRTTRQRWS